LETELAGLEFTPNEFTVVFLYIVQGRIQVTIPEESHRQTVLSIQRPKWRWTISPGYIFFYPVEVYISVWDVIGKMLVDIPKGGCVL
jgi:hypothetical protein